MNTRSRSNHRRLLCSVLLVLACAFPLVSSALQAQDVLQFSSVTHNFGSAPPGTTVTFGMKVTNTSPSTPYINFQINIMGSGASEFSEIDSCAAPIAPNGGHCEVIFTFAPTALGTATATWNLTGTGDSTFSYNPTLPGTLTGLGIVAAGLQVSTSGHNFGTEFKNYTSAPYGVVLRNSSTDPIAVTIANGNTEFPLYLPSDNCPGTLQPNQFCSIVWNFNPKAGNAGSNNQPTAYTFLNTISGEDTTTGQPVILTNGSGTQVSGVTLTGFGVSGPSNYVGLSTATHYFGEWNTGTESSLYGVQITNFEPTAVVLTATAPSNSSVFGIGPDNCFTNGYTTTLAGGASCQVQFFFQAASGGATGYQTATYGLTATHNGTPIAVENMIGGATVTGLTLSATQVKGNLSLQFASHDFGSYLVGQTNSLEFSDQIKNTGCTAIGPGCTAIGDSYTVTFATTNTGHASFPTQAGSNSCKKLTGYPVITLAAGASCNVNFEFNPQTAGELTSTFGISVVDATTSEPIPVIAGGTTVQGIALSGYGTANQGLFVPTASNNFGEQGIGGSSAAYVTYLYNSTGSVVSLSYAYSSSESENFTLSMNPTGPINACGPTLGEYATCALSWQFTPQVTGSISVVYDITATVGGSPVQIINLTNSQPVSGITLQGTGVN